MSPAASPAPPLPAPRGGRPPAAVPGGVIGAAFGAEPAAPPTPAGPAPALAQAAAKAGSGVEEVIYEDMRRKGTISSEGPVLSPGATVTASAQPLYEDMTDVNEPASQTADTGDASPVGVGIHDRLLHDCHDPCASHQPYGSLQPCSLP